jgi:hypothetical protein
MPTINPALVPTVPPGSLFNEFTTDSNISIRFLNALDPVYFEALNRPMADIALRQLILAKTVDQLNFRLGHQAIFPYLVQPILMGSISQIPVPLGLIWDMHVSLPAKWQQLRLARIKRLDGSDGIGSNDADASGSSGQGLTGHIRLMFSAVEEASPSAELFVLQADYMINPPAGQIYQVVRVSVPTIADAPNVIPAGEAMTVDGFIVFRTQDVTDPAIQAFFNNVPPPTSSHDIAAGGSPDFATSALSHGTGMLIASAWNAIPTLDSDLQIFLSTLNYPFGLDANRTSTSPVTNIVIPQALFREFNIVAPASDEPSGDVSGNFWPVWISRIQRNDTSANELEFFFSTYNVSAPPSTAPIEFASLTLDRTMTVGQVVPILPTNNLQGQTGTNANDFLQGFGKGHVALSSLWTGPTGSGVSGFFDSFIPVIDVPAEVLFPKPNTRLSSWAISRVPTTVPTAGESAALRGSMDGVASPNALNRYVVEADQGLGTKVDFAIAPALDPSRRNNTDIERFGFTGALAHRCVLLAVNSSGVAHDYPNDILPRLRILLGRDPQFGDFWYDGVRLKFFNGDTWQG